jgi:pimeloyl-ACP methyl ester carboxylesterase
MAEISLQVSETVTVTLSAGERGQDGVQGDSGVQGATGSQGATGATGSQGVSGTTAVTSPLTRSGSAENATIGLDTSTLEPAGLSDETKTGLSTATNESIKLSRLRLGVLAGFDSNKSMSTSMIAHADAASVIEPWASSSAWAGSNTQVSANKLYGTTGGGGIGRAFNVPAGKLARVVFKVNYVAGASAGQGIFVGLDRGTVGASPAAGASQSAGIYFRSVNSGVVEIRPLRNGVQEAAIYAAAPLASWAVTVTVDESYLTLLASSELGGGVRASFRFARDEAIFPVRNLSIMVNDSRGLSGSSVEPITEARNGALVTGATISGASTGHWGSDSGDNFQILLPNNYDSRRATPAVIAFHGNGSDEKIWNTNANSKSVVDAYLAAGFIVVSAANTGATSTWGSAAGNDAYTRAYQYARDHYNIGPIVFYANSMGGIQSLVALASDGIPGVVAWVGTSPTFDLDENYANAAFTSTISAAYGGNFVVNSVGHNPAALSPLLFRGIPMWMLIATDDAAVTPSANGQALYSAIASTNPRTRVETTGGHSTGAITSNAPAMVAWCNAILGMRSSWSA